MPTAATLMLAVFIPSIAVTVTLTGEHIRIETRIAKHPDNTRLDVNVDGPLSAYSAKTLHGEHEPVVHETIVTMIPKGEYEATCVLERWDRQTHTRKHFSARSSFTIGAAKG